LVPRGTVNMTTLNLAARLLQVAVWTPALCSAVCPVMSKLAATSTLRVSRWNFMLNMQYQTVGGNYSIGADLWKINTVFTLKNPKGELVATAVQPLAFWDHVTKIYDCDNKEIFQFEYKDVKSSTDKTLTALYSIKKGTELVANGTKEMHHNATIAAIVADATAGSMVASSETANKESTLFTITSAQSLTSKAQDPRLLILFLAVECTTIVRSTRFGSGWVLTLWILLGVCIFCCCASCILGCICAFCKKKPKVSAEEQQPMVIKDQQKRGFWACCAGSAKGNAQREMRSGGAPPKR